MPFAIRLYQGFPVHCSVTYNAGLFQGQGTVWNYLKRLIREPTVIVL